MSTRYISEEDVLRWLNERSAWLDKKIKHGGDFALLSARIAECRYIGKKLTALPSAPVSEEREEVARRLETEFDQDDVAHAARLLRAPQQQAESWPLDFNGYLIERAVGWRLPECVAPPPDDEAVALLQPAFDALDKINTRPVSDWEVRRAAEIACFYAVQQFRAYLAR